MTFENRLKELGLELPPPPPPKGLYRPLLIDQNLAYLSGHTPIISTGEYLTGKVGVQIDAAAGKAAARQVGLAMIATLRDQLGSLDRVERLVKLLGMVNCSSDFTEIPEVINGCSEVLAEVFGEDAGVAPRSAVGVASLPRNVSVEVEAIFRVHSE